MVVHGGVRDECMRAVLEKEHKIILDKQLVVLKLFCPENTLESTMPPHHTHEHPFLTLLSKEDYAKHVDKIDNPPPVPKTQDTCKPTAVTTKEKECGGRAGGGQAGAIDSPIGEPEPSGAVRSISGRSRQWRASTMRGCLRALCCARMLRLM